jgi:hypothetical protein
MSNELERFKLHPLRNAGYALVPDPEGEYMRFVDHERETRGAKEEERERLREVVHVLRHKREEASVEEHLRVAHGLNGAGPHSAMRAYDDAAQQVLAADSEEN